MSTGTVTITREQAAAIDNILEFGDVEDIVREHAEEGDGWESAWTPINGMPLDTLIRALYVGYKIELTEREKHDKIRDLYQTSYYGNHRFYIKEVLSILDIEVEGVNV
ncbi:hypothetical protein [Alkalihalobacillus pseudalcaliphilus]|uniref:hypothetical protein n=1 Tax=Alkalihalobacillus pseudalcaliphilus TaxID=79884 RepID=UPI00069E4E8D|nr:hypothetical protein [Alkalihalobacillus pseudalcaliphilus]